MNTTTKNTASQLQNAFNPAGDFSSPRDALCQIHKQPVPIKALLVLVEVQVGLGECGFASEVVRDFSSFTGHAPVDMKMSHCIDNEWPATFGDGVLCHNPKELENYLVGEKPFLPINHGSELDTKICFAVGELAQEQLEETAAAADVDFDKWTTSDELRARLLERAREQGGLSVYDDKGGTTTFGFDDGAKLPLDQATA